MKGNGVGASKAMRAHLSLIETRLRPGTIVPSSDVVQTLRDLWAARET